MRRRAAHVVAVALGVVAMFAAGVGGAALKLGATAPDVAGGPWIGSAPLTIGALRGRVVLVEFWTHG
jgi:hypothetical protein